MEITIIDTLIVLGFIMVLGFISNYIFNKTQIPSIVWLILFGLFVLISAVSFTEIFPNNAMAIFSETSSKMVKILSISI